MSPTQAMAPQARIESLQELKTYLQKLFADTLQFNKDSGHDVMFVVDGKVKQVMAKLQQTTGDEGWDGDSTFWVYRNDALNVSIGLSAAPGCVLVLASVASLHRAALEPYGG